MQHIQQDTPVKFDQALQTVLASARPLATERVGIEAACGQVLAEDVVSDVDMPPFNKAAMDGFACRKADIANDLTVIETVPAGFVPRKQIGPNQCAKIMTGAMVPDGADCVIMLEFAESVGEGRIRFTGQETAANICFHGEDVTAGQVVVRKETLIKPQHIALLAAAGCVRPLVSRQPRVGVIATGNELAEPAGRPGPGQIRNSNSLQLCGQVRNAGAVAVNYGIAADTLSALKQLVGKALAENDVVIISGGVSVGEYDLVREALREMGVKLLFEQVAVKPGRPTVFGVMDDRYVFGLPGNPVSVFIIFEILVKPFLYRLMGCEAKPCVIRLPLAERMSREKAGRDTWVPVVWDAAGRVRQVPYHGSAHIAALGQTQGLLCFPAGIAELPEGTVVDVRQI
jgi:molybdopterin molybdotransferase